MEGSFGWKGETVHAELAGSRMKRKLGKLLGFE
jgi:hypothetical protein